MVVVDVAVVEEAVVTALVVIRTVATVADTTAGEADAHVSLCLSLRPLSIICRA